MARRTRRSDSAYVIYEAMSPEGQNYIGVTGKTESSAMASALERWRRHRSRGVHEAREWPLYRYLREGGLDMLWKITVIEVVRGRAEAYVREKTIIAERKPTLNEQYSPSLLSVTDVDDEGAPVEDTPDVTAPPVVIDTPVGEAAVNVATVDDTEVARRVAEAEAILADPNCTDADVERALAILAS
jgi:hypothetical protein